MRQVGKFSDKKRRTDRDGPNWIDHMPSNPTSKLVREMDRTDSMERSRWDLWTVPPPPPAASEIESVILIKLAVAQYGWGR